MTFKINIDKNPYYNNRYETTIGMESVQLYNTY